MTAMRIVIAEDEAVIARRVARLTSEVLGPGGAEFSFARNVPEARELLAGTPTDLLILDLNLKGEEGFTLLRETAGEPFETIVISAHTDRALDAFDYGVRDFVAKPFSRDRLARALRRVVTSGRPPHSIRFLGVRRHGSTELIPVEDLLYVRGAGTRSELVLKNERRVMHEKLLEKLESVLPPHFERIHKSYIVDLRQVVRLETHEGTRYSLVLADGTTLPVGRTRIQSLRRKF
jgi:two-component system response regulator LytT